MIVKINNAWSWKNLSCSIIGDDLSCINKVFHVAISKKSLLYIWGLNPTHYSAILD